jgi:hypothetical protein
MSFINIDLYLVDLFHSFIKSVQDDDNCRVIDDVFSDRPVPYREAIKGYLRSKHITKDFGDREREDNIYVLPSHPLRELAFPQVAIYLAEENSADWYLGGITGTDLIPIDEPDFTGYGIENGAIAMATYRADIVANTKEEAIWISRLCQRAIYGKILELDGMGVKEAKVGMADLQLHPEHFPSLVFGRGVFLTAKVIQTWIERQPALGTYEVGRNAGV